MRIYIPIQQSDSHNMANPFVYTITDCIQTKKSNVRFEYGLNLFWNDECESVDIIHFMWPEVFEHSLDGKLDFKGRLEYLKSKGVKIISTCHNLYAHVKYTAFSDLLYDWVYEASDVIVHLGIYSLSLLEQKYPCVKHVIIPHHVYDTIYTRLVDKSDALAYLGLSSKYKYILCLGAFRTTEEKKMVERVSIALYKKKVRVIAPNIMVFPVSRKNPKLWIKAIKEWIKYRFKFGMIVSGKYISDDEICFYYGASDISFIQRVNILNSGNVPLGFFMGKVVVGPNDGNVSMLLKELGNPIFEPYDNNSVIESVCRAFRLAKSGLGERNRIYSMSNLLTADISQQYLFVYENILDKGVDIV